VKKMIFQLPSDFHLEKHRARMPFERLLRSMYTFPVKNKTSINQPNQFFHIFLSYFPSWAAVLQGAHLDGLREQTEHQWQTPAWDFGRFAKAHPLLVNLDENRALVEIKRVIGREFWTDNLRMDTADAEMAFDSVWVECRLTGTCHGCPPSA
jgi:hypothetical protein